MIRKSTAAIAALLLLFGLGACKKTESDNQVAASQTTETAATTDTTMTATGAMSTGGTVSDMAPADKEFITKAGMGGMAEVQMGNLGTSKATSAAVKAFAQRMVTDHSKANEELQTLATAKGVALPTELDSEHKDAMDHMSSLSGAAFDKAYMDDMVKDHEKDVAEFEKASQSAQDSETKAWAAKTLPTLQDHLKQAKSVRGGLK
jgi:putative membrane protein